MSIIGPLIKGAASLIGGLFGKSSQEKANEQNIRLQKQFAQEGIQWKVADAVKAGVHPLYALGAQTTAFQPTVVGDTALPNALQNMGQDIGRAFGAVQSSERKTAGVLSALAVERAGLENDLLRSQIRALSAPGTGPAVIAGNNANPLVAAGAELARHPDWSDAQDFTNRYGELADFLFGPPILAKDMAASMPGWSDGPTGHPYIDFFMKGK